MWEMLRRRGEDLALEFGEAEAGELDGAARWVARYTFPSTGRPVMLMTRARRKFP